MQWKLSFVSLSIGALLILSVTVVVTTTTQAFAQAQPPRPSPNQPGDSNIKLIGTPTVSLTEPYDERGLATTSYITVRGVTSGGGGTAELTASGVNVHFLCIDDATGEFMYSDWLPADVTSGPIEIKSGKNQPFEISTIPITEPVAGSDERCPDPESQTAVFSFAQYLDIVLTIAAKNGRGTIVYDDFPDNPR